MKKAALLTLGCKVNQSETLAIEREMRRQGFEIVPFAGKADVYIINTCTVTARADQKSREYVRHAERTNPRAEILVTGCYVERARGEMEKISPRLTVIGNDAKKNIAAFLRTRCNGGYSDKERFYGERTRAFIKIQDGCGKFCAYCVVPYVRRRIYTKPQDEVLNEVALLAGSGYKEVVLCGINLGYYHGLADLLKRIHAIGSLERIRISSIQPGDVTAGLVSIVRDYPKMCHHFHIPLQSGSSRVLRLMGRRYTADEYRSVIDRVRKNVSDAGISTDIIVGFPGETEEDFSRTYALVSELNFSRIHIFRYSPRPGTAGAVLKDDVPATVKKERANLLEKVELSLRRQFYSSYVNRVLEVLLEENKRDRMIGRFCSGFAGNYIRVAAKGTSALNRIMPVRIDGVTDDYAVGSIIH